MTGGTLWVRDADRSSEAELVRTALGELGRVVEIRNHGEALLQIDRHNPPELVVIDVAEPASACRRVAARLRGAPVLALVELAAIDAVFEAGADDVVTRPVRRSELIARARAAVRFGMSPRRRGERSKREQKLAEQLRELQRDNQRLERNACVDALTGIANRRHTLALLDAEWKRSARAQTPLSLVMVDLDAFHAFNERYGHLGGDSCLRRACAAMVTCLRRPSDFLGRYGGEEFVAVLANTDGLGARLVAERLRAAVEALAIEHASSPCSTVVTISAGFATCRAAPERVAADLLASADRALLAAKAMGRNRITGDAPAPPSRAPSTPPWPRFPIVVADPWFASRIPAFLAARRGDAIALAQARDDRAFARIRGITRRLKASAAEHGFDHICAIAAALEHAARREDLAGLGAAIDELGQYVDHVQVAYRRRLEAI
ncbi:MAG TPA: diguanylate cyclase [Kofleriaceae bacterium]|nr:diguanylate cyclase [Kofleriaceae bacterium]